MEPAQLRLCRIYLVALSDSKGKLVESYRYDVRGNLIFGGRKNSLNTNGNPSGNNGHKNTSMQNSKPRLENYRLYTSREYEPELDLYYYRSRYYDAKIGQFTSRDPLLYVDGPNPYAYVNNNPVNYVDPWGLEKLLLTQYGIGSIQSFTNPWNDIKRLNNLYLNSLYSSDITSANNAQYTQARDLNKDGKLQKKEADNWWLKGKGEHISVDNTYIDWNGLKISQGYNNGETFPLNTTEAFLKLPLETASTYGGTLFTVIDADKGVVKVEDQRYHYKYRETNSKENIARNIMTWIGKPKFKTGTDYMIYYYNSLIGVKR